MHFEIVKLSYCDSIEFGIFQDKNIVFKVSKSLYEVNGK